ncbi:Undecaprenyl phosphate N,N'-diacetylbacillosamine 1-phosphate transferase [Aquimixticola soesokkakensis]|uniref:Undecaprenyl phosphate N,N'-diacetylbacillosamine 1-phosphate transferase n=1 Tax=Aquimixticola soesokkakensis TaxID=1519096 RepID=A0A1Y5SYQ9_9RHOB|nr:sugar transferase [Aquimixticola soesokkakensis]SLN51183.1 Undecaprenyl phosphate N,N'-diacetylbacillosamine 1-phosphate transferase [Aquimixticola soesokkakensis]
MMSYLQIETKTAFEPVPTTTQKFSLYADGAKRVLDVMFAIALMPILLPVIVLLWAMVRLDGGAGFYSQKRVGKDGKVFNCLKLRTMVLNAEKVLEDLCASDPEVAAEWERDQKLRNDPRITRVGKFLRATSLDELPQFFNVLRGDMSFVGPRPFMVSQQMLYVAAGGRAYFRMRPGITGAWQIDGRGVSTFADRVGYDESYYDKLSFLTDTKYMLATVKIVAKRTGH